MCIYHNISSHSPAYYVGQPTPGKVADSALPKHGSPAAER